MSKKLVAFFTASGQTKSSAQQISKLLNCDLYEIKPKQKYSSADLNWDDKNSRSTVECKDRNCRPELADKNANIEKYDTILVGFPVWWYLAPNIILSFLEAYDFRGKKVVVWGTSWSSGMGESTNEIKKVVKGATVVEGTIFDKDHRRESDYKKFIEKL